MSEYRPLYLSKCIEALDLIALQTEIKTLKFARICKLLNKLYTESNADPLDQEKTYVLLARYLHTYHFMVKSQIDPKFMQIRYAKEVADVETKYQKVRKFLQERYSTQQKPTVEETIVEEPTKEAPIFIDQFITCETFFSILKSVKQILIVDARRSSEFLCSRVLHDNVINVPEESIQPGLSAHMLGKKLDEQAFEKWDRRDTYDLIVMLDWNATQETYQFTRMATLVSSIADWDLNRQYREKPLVLVGGFLRLLETYPSICYNPSVLLQFKDTELEDLLDVESIEYPQGLKLTNAVLVDDISDQLLLDSDEQSTLELSLAVSEDQLLQQNKIITVDRKCVMSTLMQQEEEWKTINKLIEQEKNPSVLSDLKSRQKAVREEITKLERTLKDLNALKGSLSHIINTRIENGPDDSAFKQVAMKNKKSLESNDEEQLKLLEVVANERVAALKEARANKPQPAGDNEPERVMPLVNRNNKPNPALEGLTGRMHYTYAATVGLKNINNTCFMNSILQCVSNLEPIKDLFLSGQFARRLKKDPIIAIQTASLIRSMWSCRSGFIIPGSFHQKMCELKASYLKGLHEDAFEFFDIWVDNLIADTITPVTRLDTMTPMERAWCSQFSNHQSPFTNMLYHMICVKQLCKTCTSTAQRFQIERTFMIGIPDHSFHLKDALSENFADYIIDDLKCANCKTPVTNRQEFAYLPKVLVIVLKRYRPFMLNGELQFKKIESDCSFTTQLELANTKYELSGVSLHSGNINLGHYTALINTRDGWMEYNDELVLEAPALDSDRIRRLAYMFFYTRVDQKRKI